MACTQVQAEAVVPLKGQSSQQTQLDINDCRNVAASQSSSTPPPSGGRLRGAAVGAAAGAVGAEVRGRQHDEFYEGVDDVKQEYRQNRAGQTAAAGAVVGGARQRQERRAQQQTNASTSSTAYTSCLQGRGYQVTP
jgi:hypothetical protein